MNHIKTFGTSETNQSFSLGNVKSTICITIHSIVDDLEAGELKGVQVYQFMKLVMIMNEAFRRKASTKIQNTCDQLLIDLKSMFKRYDATMEAPFLVTEELFDRLMRLVASFDKLVDEGGLREVDFAIICDRVNQYLTIGEAKRRGMKDDEMIVSTTNRNLNPVGVFDMIEQDITVAKVKG